MTALHILSTLNAIRPQIGPYGKFPVGGKRLVGAIFAIWPVLGYAPPAGHDIDGNSVDLPFVGGQLVVEADFTL